MKRYSLHQPDYVLLGITTVLLMIGLVMLSSAGAVLGFQRFGDSNYFLKHQAISLVVGLMAALITYRIDYRQWLRWATPLMIGTIIVLLAVWLPGIGSFYLGARRWILIGPLTFQPSELAKLTTILYLAAWLEKRHGSLKNVSAGLAPFLLLTSLIAGLILAQPDLGTAAVIFLVAVTLYFTSGGTWPQLVGLCVAGLGLIWLVIKLAPYRAQRFTVFLNPDLDPQGIGYHINQALLAIGSGGIFGLGLGHSRQKFNYLPEPAGDSIFAITAEELGFLFVTVFIVLWSAFVYRGLMIARRAPDSFGRVVAIGVTAWLGLQAFINMAALSGLLPLTGIPLPLMSHGGTALIVNLAAIGILLNISRQTTYSYRRP